MNAKVRVDADQVGIERSVMKIEEMRTRMNELAAGEQDLVRALGDALSRTDQKLLEDVRSVAADHQARRGAILNELAKLGGADGRAAEAAGAIRGLDRGAATSCKARRRGWRAAEAPGAIRRLDRSAAGFAAVRDAAAGARWRRLAPGGR